MKTRTFAVAEKISGEEIRQLRQYVGLNRRELAQLAGVSVRTIEYWENDNALITGPMVLLAKLMKEYPDIPERLVLPEQVWQLRLLYMFRDEICTMIDLDTARRLAAIKNYTDRLQFRALGSIEHPSYEQVMDFLKERCFPETLDKMKIRLKELDLPFYDPLMIIEKTGGRMAEDEFWIRVIKK